jgi:phosphate starvation-inducible PhoH-like protein
MKQRKPDRSKPVSQREKIKDTFKIRDFQFTEKQKDFIKLALNPESKIIFVNGVAGTSKTFLAIYCALMLLNAKKKTDSIFYIRSAVESSDSKLGFLPGEIEDKVGPYNGPLIDKLEEFLDKNTIDWLTNDNRIIGMPVNFVRGLNWNCKAIIVDEAQNMTYKEILTLITRLGEFSKCFILADPLQSDLPISKAGGFEKMTAKFNDEESKVEGIFSFFFGEEDIMRSKLVKFIVKKTKS